MKVTQKTGVQFLGGMPMHVPNEVMEVSKDFYISFNASSRDYGCPTTALVLGQGDKFYILCGDHRKAYAGMTTFDECLTYYKSLPDQHHAYSDKLLGD